MRRETCAECHLAAGRWWKGSIQGKDWMLMRCCPTICSHAPPDQSTSNYTMTGRGVIAADSNETRAVQASMSRNVVESGHKSTGEISHSSVCRPHWALTCSCVWMGAKSSRIWKSGGISSNICKVPPPRKFTGKSGGHWNCELTL